MECDFCKGNVVIFYDKFLHQCTSCLTIFKYDFHKDSIFKKEADYDRNTDCLHLSRYQLYDTIIYDRFLPKHKDTFSTISITDGFEDTQNPTKLLINCINLLNDTNSKIILKIRYNIRWFEEYKRQFGRLLYKQRNFFTIEGLESLFSKQNMFLNRVDRSNMLFTTLEFSFKPFLMYTELYPQMNGGIFRYILNELEVMKNFLTNTMSSHMNKGFVILIDLPLKNFAELVNKKDRCFNLVDYNFDSSVKYFILTPYIFYNDMGRVICI